MSYEAIRLKDELYVEYYDGSLEYYDLKKDPYELDNTAADLPAERKATLHEALTAIKGCKTASECWDAQHVK